MLRAFESMYLLYDHGVLSRDIWDGWQKFLSDYATSPGVQRYWSARRDVFSPSFRHFIDALSERETGVRFPDLLEGSTVPRSEKVDGASPGQLKTDSGEA